MADEGGKLSSNGLYMTDANGEILIRDIVGTLVVTEVKTIPGYTIDEATRSQTIVVNPDDLQTLIVYNIPAGGLQIIKSDEDTGERLGGVKFEIRKINGEILGTYTTDRDGVISIPNAESGWYTIVERKAKDGYALDTTPVNACVKDSETTTVEITNQRMASIMIHKIDAATGAGIYGVKFVLYDSGKNPIGEYTRIRTATSTLMISWYPESTTCVNWRRRMAIFAMSSIRPSMSNVVNAHRSSGRIVL